jgi:hypothetical protein
MRVTYYRPSKIGWGHMGYNARNDEIGDNIMQMQRAMHWVCSGGAGRKAAQAT